jgi:Tol biopolymer transport system component/DNA-binding winged helix-turn-helix (wHTH) protein
VTYEFDDIRVDLEQMLITRSGARVDVEPKAFDVLRHLVEHRARLVTKDELLDTVWRGTFVTPNVLTRAVAQLRKALGDDAHQARYIETVSRRGYRFIAPVTTDGGQTGVRTGVRHPSDPNPGQTGVRPRSDPVRRLQLIMVMLVIGLAGFALARRLPARPAVTPLPAPERVTIRSGNNTSPTLSPDGRAVAFVSDRTGSLEIYVLGLARGSQDVAITNDGGQNMQPGWSPDGRWIAFHSRTRGGVWIVPSTGGTPRQIVERGSDAAWSPDSQRLVYTPDEGGTAGQQVLWTVGRDGTGRRPLTEIGHPAGGHNHPTWSRNGRFVAFAVSNGIENQAIWIVDATGGPPRQLASTHAASHPQFGPDDRAVFWTGNVATFNGRLFRIALDPSSGTTSGEAEIVMPFDNGTFKGLSVVPNGDVAFAIEATDANLWRIDLTADGAVSAPVRLTDDVVRNGRPDYSHDGRIAFFQIGPGRPIAVWAIDENGANRTALVPDGPAGGPNWSSDGSRVLFMRGMDGQDAALWWMDVASRRVTPAGITGRDIRSARLSPDSQEVAFHVLEPNGTMNVWTQSLDGGSRRRVTNDREAISYPVWSPDGRWLAVEVKRGERTNIGVVARGGGPIEMITEEAGQHWPHSWSPDGEHIVYAAERGAVWNIWQVSRRTRATRQLTHFTSSSGYVRYPSWSPRGNRIVFERETRTATVWTIKLPAISDPRRSR